jgi:hypothetical protein
MCEFESIFKTGDERRDNFLARIFGIFAEQVVIHWCQCSHSDFDYEGRPTIRKNGASSWQTLDFVLKGKWEPHKGKLFVAEMKCELAFEKYKYLRLEDPTALQHHCNKEAFNQFLEVCKSPSSFTMSATTNGKKKRQLGTPAGAILIWGAMTVDGRTTVMNQYGFVDVLSVEKMLEKLHEWNCPSWRDYMQQIRSWSSCLFDYLTPKFDDAKSQ